MQTIIIHCEAGHERTWNASMGALFGAPCLGCQPMLELDTLPPCPVCASFGPACCKAHRADQVLATRLDNVQAAVDSLALRLMAVRS